MDAKRLESDVTLAVLAGGEGARMGRPKGLIEIGGRPILAVLLEQWAWKGTTLLVTAPGREHPPAWEAFGREVSDPVAGEGPLRGVLTALEQAATPLVIVATVDMPAVGHAQLEFVAGQAIRRPDALGILLRRRAGDEQRIEPFPSGFRTTAAPLLAARLASGRRALQPLAADRRFAVVDAPAAWTEGAWTNLNEPDELAAYTALLPRRRGGNDESH